MPRPSGFKYCQVCGCRFYNTCGLEYYDSSDSDGEYCANVQRSKTNSPFCDECYKNRSKECSKMSKRA